MTAIFKKNKTTIITKILLLVFISFQFSCDEKINRFNLVSRHNVEVTSFDSLASLSVGNGSFAFTVDATGLQTFPEIYENGVCLGTMSEWGWHSFPNEENYRMEETYEYFDVENRKVPYAVQWNNPERKQDAANYFRMNPHRLHLAGIGFDLLKSNYKSVGPNEIGDVSQQLNMWEGLISSSFTVEEDTIKVKTCNHSQRDLIGVRVQSDRIKKQLLGIKIRFPYPTSEHVDGAANWEKVSGHSSELIEWNAHSAVFQHTIDTTTYFLKMNWANEADIVEKEPHSFILKPTGNHSQFEVSIEFSNENNFGIETDFETVKKSSSGFWENYWETGGVVDFSETDDPRAHELERRVVLSQYLTRVQCAGNYPPQETGLTFNSWYGKFHMEMHWWHAAHWAYWNRPELLEKSLGYYFDIRKKAEGKAEIQGYEGARWPKMTYNFGNDSPSGVGEFLIWQQPHIIYFVEQLYRKNQDEKTLEKYLPLVTATANFMADFARWDENKQRYTLGPPLIPAQESLEKEKTKNPPFELAYWHWGLTTAQQWLKRLGMPPNSEWQNVIDNLSELPQGDGLYLAAESAPDSYQNEEYYSDHPMVLGAFGILPETLPIDTAIMENTFNYIKKNWNWERTWGWDYPMAAMCATRLGKPEEAIDLLLKDVLKNTYLVNGHNYQGNRLRIYLPGNGGLLTAVAMMCAGYEGNTYPNPGFPKGWVVRWENLRPVF